MGYYDPSYKLTFSKRIPAMPLLLPQGVTINNTIGACEIGVIFSCMMFGITTIQAYHYFQNSRRDPFAFKSIITLLWMIDVFHFGITFHIIYFYSILHYGDVFALLSPTWSIPAQIIATNISNPIVQCLFSLSVWKLSGKNIPLVGVILFCSIFGGALGIALGVKISFLLTFLDFKQISWMLYLANSLNIVADMTIALSQMWFFYRSRTGVKRSDSIINLLILYSINTGLLTGAFSILELIIYSLKPDTLIYLGIYFVFSRLFFNALLSTLNAREVILGKHRNTHEVTSDKIQVSVPLTGTSMQTETTTGHLFESEFLSIDAAASQGDTVRAHKGQSWIAPV